MFKANTYLPNNALLEMFTKPNYLRSWLWPRAVWCYDIFCILESLIAINAQVFILDICKDMKIWLMPVTIFVFSMIVIHFPCYWPFVRGIHRSPVNSPHKGQWRGALRFSLIYAWINGWVNNCEAGDLRRHRIFYDIIVMIVATNSWKRPQLHMVELPPPRGHQAIY